jgi:hypothetical protein
MEMTSVLGRSLPHCSREVGTREGRPVPRARSSVHASVHPIAIGQISKVGFVESLIYRHNTMHQDYTLSG